MLFPKSLVCFISSQIQACLEKVVLHYVTNERSLPASYSKLIICFMIQANIFIIIFINLSIDNLQHQIWTKTKLFLFLKYSLWQVFCPCQKKKMFLDAQKQLTYMKLHVFGTIRKKYNYILKQMLWFLYIIICFSKCQPELDLDSSNSLSLHTSTLLRHCYS